jgi:tripartite-type tricarboxylate transporter receptor subunit TctC
MAVVAGEVDFSFTNMTDALPQMEAKTVRGIAVTSLSRSPFAPELPTMQEVGIPNFSAESWNGVMAPAGTPAEVVERLARSFKEMEKDKEVVKAMALVGATAVSTTPGEYRQRIEAEMKQWSELLKEFQKPK